ncbi:MAG: hypothetical protein EXS42_03745 [Lacunisphaera sp.]|nr:hypothetical protein [Lacunisphaera sp.]
MNRRLFLSAAAKACSPGAAGLPLLLVGCLNVKTEPIEVKPIHITAAFAETAAKIRARMAQRLPALDGLRAQEVIG